ncbi:CYFA0S13e02993g1_1 [Cyberlindnera fabianii]|uniref:CYFA0S13e02993g1_1 n=1 Tax=Cyberlindnera fabianii TaxID=36022 RepID=A0A061B862_CYBFA|nr:CYFA0S13e02993g1_1 [Cyberlindnera fabianii]
MPGPIVAGPTIFALAAGAIIGAGVAAIIYETDIVQDIKDITEEFKIGYRTIVEKRKQRAKQATGATRALSNPFDDDLSDLYHTPSASERLNLSFGSSSTSDSDDDDKSVTANQLRNRRAHSSNDSFGTAIKPKRYRGNHDESILIFPGASSDSSTNSENASAFTSDSDDIDITTPSVTDSEAAVVSDADSEFSDGVMVDLTSENEELASSSSTLTRARLTN